MNRNNKNHEKAKIEAQEHIQTFGGFETAEEAAIAYDKVAVVMGYPVEALNFPEHYEKWEYLANIHKELRPLTEEEEKSTEEIYNAFEDVSHRSLQGWRNLFESSVIPVTSIPHWLHIARAYTGWCEELDEEQKPVLFELALDCAYAPPETIREEIFRDELPGWIVDGFIEEYYGPQNTWMFNLEEATHA